MIASAVAREGEWPVSSTTKVSLSIPRSTTAPTEITVAVRRTDRSNAISPNPSPRPIVLTNLPSISTLTSPSAIA